MSPTDVFLLLVIIMSEFGKILLEGLGAVLGKTEVSIKINPQDSKKVEEPAQRPVVNREESTQKPPSNYKGKNYDPNYGKKIKNKEKNYKKRVDRQYQKDETPEEKLKEYMRSISKKE